MLTYIPEFMQVLTPSGWQSIWEYNVSCKLFTLNEQFNHEYKVPKTYSKYSYDGPVLEIDTDLFTTYLKPSTKVLGDSEIWAKELKKGMRLRKFSEFCNVQRCETTSWKGELFSVSFDAKVYLPVKYSTDYCLLVIE